MKKNHMYHLLFTGDTFLRNKREGDSPFSRSVCDLFDNSQHKCINLETTIGNRSNKKKKAFVFQSSPLSLRYLIDNKINICSLANNHSNDFEEDGLIETIEHLNNNNISYIGTKLCNTKELEINSQRVVVCSYFGREKGLAELIPSAIIADIQKLKKNRDIIIVCLHWGQEYVAYPSPKQQQIARSLIDAGASVIIGHHPHVMQGYEEYKGGLIFYSLGNFNFFVDHPYAKKLVETTKAYCVGLNIGKKGKIKFDIIPIHINEFWQPCIILKEKEVKIFNNYLQKICLPLKSSISSVLYFSEASPKFFHNHLPSWKKRIKEHGIHQVFKFILWIVHPSIYVYYLGLILSVFHKSVKYS